MILKNCYYFILLIICTGYTQVKAMPFDACPTQAFLVQDKVARLYGVQLANGHYYELSPYEWNVAKLNALSFNLHDRYLYAYSYYYGTIVRIDADFGVSHIPLSGLPNIGFYVGDIAVSSNKYYIYRPGRNYGLYMIDMDQLPENNTVTKIINGSDLSLAIFDLAFHPEDGYAYAVDKWGNLYQIDVDNGDYVKISNVGKTGVFGAAYFDVEGNLYISRNNDGHIFRIDISANYPLAELFAFGPASSNNDGARCALAPIESEQLTMDFGDAPDSYGTLMSSNGARHMVSTDEPLYLGNTVTADSGTQENTPDNADDGVLIIGDLKPGENVLIQVQASASAYLNAWIDWDGNGQFDQDESIASDTPMTSGTNSIVVRVPAWAVAGDSWSRFRLSSSQGIGPLGGVAGGEVEDYPVVISHHYLVNKYYPAPDSYATIAFEDNWPMVGDYDFNDMVVQYRLTKVLTDQKVLALRIEGRVVAMGASHHNGFAFQIKGLTPSNVDTSRAYLKVNNINQSNFVDNDNSTNLIIDIADDVWDFVTAGEDCRYYRTEAGCGSGIQMTFSAYIPLNVSVPEQNMASFPFDPFMFSSTDYDRGNLFSDTPGQRYEIHLPGYPATERFSLHYYGRFDDRSSIENNQYFVNENGLPWAINVPYPWRHPLEYMDITYAYPEFHDYLLSAGTTNTDWYLLEKALLKNLFED